MVDRNNYEGHKYFFVFVLRQVKDEAEPTLDHSFYYYEEKQQLYIYLCNSCPVCLQAAVIAQD